MTDRRHEPKNRLSELLEQLPREVEPPEALWHSIRGMLEGRTGRVDELARRARLDIAPPEDLWLVVRSRIESSITQATGRAGARERFWLDAAAAVAVSTIVALIGLFALSVSRLPDGGSGLETPAFADTAWPAQLTAMSTRRNEAAVDAYVVDMTEQIRRNYEAVRLERLAIETSMARDYENPDLRSLWQHTYETELQLIDEAGKLLDSIERGFGT